MQTVSSDKNNSNCRKNYFKNHFAYIFRHCQLQKIIKNISQIIFEKFFLQIVETNRPLVIEEERTSVTLKEKK